MDPGDRDWYHEDQDDPGEDTSPARGKDDNPATSIVSSPRKRARREPRDDFTDLLSTALNRVGFPEGAANAVWMTAETRNEKDAALYLTGMCYLC